MKHRADVVELLRAGYSNAAIARQLNVCAKATVAPIRAALGLPKARPGCKAAGTVEDLFWRRVRPLDDGHMEWTGYRASSGAPSLRHGGHNLSAYRIAYRIANGHEPDGHVRPGCDRDSCVAPACQTDRASRAETRKVDRLYSQIFGESA